LMLYLLNVSRSFEQFSKISTSCKQQTSAWFSNSVF
jgi:hypothetical protein